MADTNKMRDDLPSMVKQAITEHPGYAEFAAWCESQLIHPYPIYFLIWQASREAVVVELPVQTNPRPEGEASWHSIRNESIAACRRAIEAAGLKVAP